MGKILPDPEYYGTKIRNIVNGAISEAVRWYREYVDRGGDVTELQRCACVKLDTWRQILDYDFVIIEVLGLGYRIRTALKQFPKPYQKRLWDKGIKVWTGAESVHLTLSDLQFEGRFVRQVFGRERVRSIREQKLWLKTHPPLFPNYATAAGYVVPHSRNDCLLTLAELRSAIKTVQALQKGP